MIHVLFVCHGNICRSTMSQFVMQYLVEAQQLQDQFYIDSAATSREEIGNDVHYGTKSKLSEMNIKFPHHSALQMTKKDYTDFDYLIGMDEANLRNMQRISGGDPQHKIYSLLSFAGRRDSIADPWYTGNFDATFQDVWKGCTALLETLKKEL